MDFVAAVGAHEQSAAVVQPGEGSFDNPAVASESGAVCCLTASDDRLDAAAPDEPAILVVVVAAIGKQRLRPSARPARPAAHRRHAVEQLQQLGDVVAVGGGLLPGQRLAAAVYEEMVLAARASAIDRAGTGFRAPFFACR